MKRNFERGVVSGGLVLALTLGGIAALLGVGSLFAPRMHVDLNLPEVSQQQAKEIEHLALLDAQAYKLASARMASASYRPRDIEVASAKLNQAKVWPILNTVLENAHGHVIQAICSAGGDPAELGKTFEGFAQERCNKRPVVGLTNEIAESDFDALKLFVGPINNRHDAQPWEVLREYLDSIEMADLTRNRVYSTWHSVYQRLSDRGARNPSVVAFARIINRFEQIARVRATSDPAFGGLE